MKTNYRLDLCYEGTRYKGWQRLGNTDNTIQFKVESTLSRILNQEITVTATGRTDAGVHADIQVCSFTADTDMPVKKILSSLRCYLPSDIGALSLQVADDRFHPRFNCKRKTYLYRVWNSESPNVFERNYLYEFTQSLDIDLMTEASKLFLGKHDFLAFSNAKHMKKSTIRDIYSIDIIQNGCEILFYFTGNGFLQGMVRILVGTLLEIGSHQKKISDIPKIFDSMDRSNAGFTAPAKGLILYNIIF